MAPLSEGDECNRTTQHIHIPATAFGARASARARCKLHSTPRSSSPTLSRTPASERHASAAAARAAALESLRLRAAAAVAHAQTVAANERARRAAEADARARRLAQRLAAAEESRRRVYEEKLISSPHRRARARRDAIRDALLREERETHCARIRAVELARRRRRGLIGERAARAARLSPSNIPLARSLAEQLALTDDTRTSVGGDGVYAERAERLEMKMVEKKSVQRPQSARSRRAAAGRIVSACVLLHTARRNLHDAGASAHAVARSSFEQLATLVEDCAVRAAAARAVLAVENRTSDAAARVLLSALIIALYPDSAAEGVEIVRGARALCAALYFGTVRVFSRAWRAWRRAFKEWKLRDKSVLLDAIIKDALATERLRVAAADTPEWSTEIQNKQLMLRDAVRRLAGDEGTEKLDAALAAARTAVDEHLIHEMLVDLPALLAHTATPKKVPQREWQLLTQELSANPVKTDALKRRVSELSALLNGMIEGIFTPPQIPDKAPDVEYAQKLLETTCTALHACQSEAMDSALAEWRVTAAMRIANGQFAPVLQELFELCARTRGTIAALRVRAIAPAVQEHGPAWARATFEQRLQRGEFERQLPRTRAVLISATRENSKCNAQQAIRSIIAYMLTVNTPWLHHNIPEIFAMDTQRVARLHNSLQRAAVLSALCATLRALHCANEDIDTSKLQAVLEDPLVTREDVIESAAALAPAHVQRALARALCARALNTDRGALGVMLRRVHAAFRQRLHEHAHATLEQESLSLPHSARSCIDQSAVEAERMCHTALRVHGTRLADLIRCVEIDRQFPHQE